MNLAFYAPMKPPTHSTPSGDRLIARLFIDALQTAGHRPLLASRFRSWEGNGDAVRQARLRRTGERLGERLLRRFRAMDAGSRPACWFSYHLYHKAPDWLGPRVSRALGIPYVVAEASLAPKQAGGPWREGYEASVAAVAGADLVVALNSADVPCVAAAMPNPDRLIRLPPFLDLARFDGSMATAERRREIAARLGAPAGRPWLVTAAMMRRGNKLDSYRVLAKALAARRGSPWHLIIAGDGPARGEVEAAFTGLADRVTFAGLIDPAALPELLGVCDLFVWPAVNEPLGMAMLEAQAAGLPVIAGNSGGVADIVRDGETGRLLPPGDAEAFAGAVFAMLSDPAGREAMGRRARAHVADCHGLEAAARALDGWLRALPGRGAP